MSEPFVTVAIACRDDEAHIEACVRSAQAQAWPRDRLQIVVADGMSMDATRETLARLAAEDDRIVLADNPARGRAAGLNECIRRAKGGTIVRFDPAGHYESDFVRLCVGALDRTGADRVGGVARPRGRSFMERCVAAAVRSPFGVRAAVGAGARDEGWPDGVRPGAFRRAVFERVGLFDPAARADEDDEMGRRIVASGGRVARAGELAADYAPGDSVRGLAKRSFSYGRDRARTMLKHGRFSTWGPALPLLWLAAEVALAARSPRRGLPWSLGAYALATGAEAVRAGRSEGALAVPLVWALFPVLHAAHGAGFAAGLARYVTRPDWDLAERAAPLLEGDAPGA